MTRIAFTADLHIDEYGTGRDPTTGLNRRLVDYLKTTRFVAETAAAEGCDALVVAGDITERRHANDWLLRHIADALSDFTVDRPGSVGILLRGNHDAEVAGESKVTALADMLGWRQATNPAIEVVGDVALVLMPYLDKHWMRAQPGLEVAPEADIYRALADAFVAIARGLYAQARTAYPDKACVLVMHQTLSGGWMSDTQQAFFGEHGLVIDTGALASIGFEGIVAGHLHRHQEIPASVPVLYTGSIERVDFAEAEHEKGFIVADIERGRFGWRFVETFARRYVTVSGADLGDEPEDVEGAIVRVRDLPAEYDPALVRRDLEQRGAFEVHSIERIRVERPEVTGGIAEALSPHQALEAFFAEDDDRDALVERGRELIGAAS